MSDVSISGQDQGRKALECCCAAVPAVDWARCVAMERCDDFHFRQKFYLIMVFHLTERVRGVMRKEAFPFVCMHCTLWKGETFYLKTHGCIHKSSFGLRLPVTVSEFIQIPVVHVKQSLEEPFALQCATWGTRPYHCKAALSQQVGLHQKYTSDVILRQEKSSPGGGWGGGYVRSRNVTDSDNWTVTVFSCFFWKKSPDVTFCVSMCLH